MNSPIETASLALGVGQRAFFRQVAKEHPFSNYDEVGDNWWRQYRDCRSDQQKFEFLRTHPIIASYCRKLNQQYRTAMSA